MKNFISQGYIVNEFNTSKEAVEYLKNNVVNKTVGFGGSITLDTIGLYDVLKENNIVYWHWKNKDSDTYFKAANAEIYISSVNAISRNGEIVNIDGTANRVSSMMYGHKKVIFVVGKNKIVDTLDEAINRARNIAAPLNAKRLNKATPCTIDLKCHDCKSKDRICRAMSILLDKPTSCEYEICIINEDLGY